jgi:hypothetical protein
VTTNDLDEGPLVTVAGPRDEFSVGVGAFVHHIIVRRRARAIPSPAAKPAASISTVDRLRAISAMGM